MSNVFRLAALAAALAPVSWAQEAAPAAVSATALASPTAAVRQTKPCSMTFEGLPALQAIPIDYLASYQPLARQFGNDCPAYYSRGADADSAEFIPAGDSVNAWKTMFAINRTSMPPKEIVAAYKEMIEKSGGVFEVTQEKDGKIFFHYAIETADPARGALAGTEYAVGVIAKVGDMTTVMRNLDRNPLSPADELSFTQILTGVLKKK